MVKALDFMGLKYNDLYHKARASEVMRSTLYKENTNVLAYYVIKTIMLNNYQSFLSWCKTNNLSLLQFKKTASNQSEFCRFIEKNYKTKSMLENVGKMETFYYNIKDKSLTSNTGSSKNDIHNFIFNNMRMSICEMG
jgi:hypothetical protein